MIVALVVILAVIYLLSTGNVAAGLFDRLVKRADPMDKEKIQHKNARVALVVLGAGTCANAATGKVEPSDYGFGRIFWTTRIYQSLKKNNSECNVFMTGKGNLVVSEAEVYTKKLIEAGVDRSDIILEDKSMNTWENAKFTSDILKRRPLYDHIYVLTAGYHLARCHLYFSRFIHNFRGVYTDSDNLEKTWKPSYIYFFYSLSLLFEEVKIFIHNNYYWRKNLKEVK